MELLLNLVFAVIAYLFVKYVAVELGAKHPLEVAVALIAAIVVFFANFAANLV